MGLSGLLGAVLHARTRRPARPARPPLADRRAGPLVADDSHLVERPLSRPHAAPRCKSDLAAPRLVVAAVPAVALSLAPEPHEPHEPHEPQARALDARSYSAESAGSASSSVSAQEQPVRRPRRPRPPPPPAVNDVHQRKEGDAAPVHKPPQGAPSSIQLRSISANSATSSVTSGPTPATSPALDPAPPAPSSVVPRASVGSAVTAAGSADAGQAFAAGGAYAAGRAGWCPRPAVDVDESARPPSGARAVRRQPGKERVSWDAAGPPGRKVERPKEKRTVSNAHRARELGKEDQAVSLMDGPPGRKVERPREKRAVSNAHRARERGKEDQAVKVSLMDALDRRRIQDHLMRSRPKAAGASTAGMGTGGPPGGAGASGGAVAGGGVAVTRVEGAPPPQQAPVPRPAASVAQVCHVPPLVMPPQAVLPKRPLPPVHVPPSSPAPSELMLSAASFAAEPQPSSLSGRAPLSGGLPDGASDGRPRGTPDRVPDGAPDGRMNGGVSASEGRGSGVANGLPSPRQDALPQDPVPQGAVASQPPAPSGRRPGFVGVTFAEPPAIYARTAGGGAQWSRPVPQCTRAPSRGAPPRPHHGHAQPLRQHGMEVLPPRPPGLPQTPALPQPQPNSPRGHVAAARESLAATRHVVARDLDAGRLPPVQRRPRGVPNVTRAEAHGKSGGAGAVGQLLYGSCPVQSSVLSVDSALSRKTVSNSSDRGAGTVKCDNRAFFPSVSAPELSASDAESSDMWAARDKGAFPASQSHCEPESKKRSSRKLNRRRPPPLVTPKGGGAGFSTGAPLLDESAKRIPVAMPFSASVMPRDGSGGSGLRRAPSCDRKDSRKMSSGSTGSRFNDSSLYRTSRENSSSGTLDRAVASGGSHGSGGSGGRTVSSSSAFDEFEGGALDDNGSGRGTEDDPYDLDEASQTSFGEMATRSAVQRARNGILPEDAGSHLKRTLANIAAKHQNSEEHFVFGSEGQFTDGGFVITADGVMQAPESVYKYYSSDKRDAPRSTNFIHVRSLDDFEHGPTIGAGCHGHVYLAMHIGSRAKMAVKVINVFDDKKREQVREELRTLSSHTSHYLVRSYGAFYDGRGFMHVTLEYMDRGALSDVVARGGSVPEAVVRHIARNCLGGLTYLHKNRVLHRDFKTANILLSRRAGVAKLSDFGLARNLIPGTSQVQTWVGTIAYMSPERLHGAGYTYGSDIWGLGISLLECILGRYPFEKPQSYFDYVEAAAANPWEHAAGCASREMLDFIARCTQIEPTNRANVDELSAHPLITGTLSDGTADSIESDAIRFCAWLEGLPEVAAVVDGTAPAPAHVEVEGSPAPARGDVDSIASKGRGSAVFGGVAAK